MIGRGQRAGVLPGGDLIVAGAAQFLTFARYAAGGTPSAS